MEINTEGKRQAIQNEKFERKKTATFTPGDGHAREGADTMEEVMNSSRAPPHSKNTRSRNSFIAIDFAISIYLTPFCSRSIMNLERGEISL